MDVRNLAQVGPQVLADGNLSAIRADHAGSLVVTQAHGRLYEAAYRKNLHFVTATVTAMVAYTTVTATGGPVIFNPVGNAYNAVILGVSWGIQTAGTATAAALGLTGGPAASFTAVTAADSSGNTFLGGPATTMTLARVGTPNYPVGTSAPAGFFYALGGLNTTALTALGDGANYVDLAGQFVVPPGYYITPTVSDAVSSDVDWVTVLYEEVPV